MLRASVRCIRGLYTSLRHATPVTSTVWTRRYATEHNVVKSPFKDVEIPNMNLTHFIWERLEEWSDRPAVVCGLTGRSYTYKELRERARKFATTLHIMKVEPGSVLGIILPNCPDFPAVLLGAIEAGLVVTTFNPSYHPEEIAKQMVDIAPTIIVTFPEKYPHVIEATRLAAESGYRPPAYFVTQALESAVVPPGAVDIRELTESDMDMIPLPGHKAKPNITAIVPYSSGTTGLPKGVMLSHRNVVANCTQVDQEPQISVCSYHTDKTIQDNVLAVLPFYHCYGLVSILLSKIRLGLKIVIIPKFQPEIFIEALRKHKFTVLPLAPLLVLFIGTHPQVKPEMLEPVKMIICGSAPLGEKDLARVAERMPHVNILQGFGMTELSPVTNVNTMGSRKGTSVGPCVPNTYAKVIDLNTRENLGPGKLGEICFKGPQMMLGYYKNPKATAETIDESGWLHSGDMGYYDEEHYFYIVDRLKELIKVKGLQVAPAELEDIIRSHPNVAEAAVIGIPDDHTGEAPMAYIVAKQTSSSEHLQRDIKEYVAGKVSQYKQIKEVRIVEKIPKNQAGKILRKELRDLYKKEKS